VKATPEHQRFHDFGPFRVDAARRLLLRNDKVVPLTPKAFEILLILLQNCDRVVEKDELLRLVWPDTAVEENNLTRNVSTLRKALEEGPNEHRFVVTVPGRGYQFVSEQAEMKLQTEVVLQRRARAEVEIEEESEFAARAITSARELAVDAALPRTDASPAIVLAETPGRGVKKPKKLSYSIALIAGFVALFVGAFILWRSLYEPSGQLKVVRFVQVTNDGQPKSGPLATDGSRIYFTEIFPGQTRSLVQVSSSGGEVVRLPSPLVQPSLMDLTPERGELLLANQEESGAHSIWIQPLVGGSPRLVGSGLVETAAWGSHGTTVVYGDKDSVYVMNRDGTDFRKVLRGPGTPYAFSFSPNGQVLRFSLGYGPSSSIIETSADGKNPRELVPGCCGKWTPDGGYFIFQREREDRSDLWALPEPGGLLQGTGKKRAIQLTAGPLEFRFPIPSMDGKEIFALGHSSRAEVVRYDPRTREFAPFLAGVSAEGLSFSRDAEWVAYASYPDGRLWRSRIDGSERLQLTFPPMRVAWPKWSSDGRQIAFSATFPGRPWNIYIVSADGGTPKQPLPDAEDRTDVNWSSDGNSLLFGSFGGSLHGPHPISIVDLRTRSISTLPGSVGLYSPRVSPDGRYVCAMTWDSYKLMLFDFSTQQWTPLSDSDLAYPNWSHDGRYIYFERLPGHGGAATVERIRVSDHKSETVADLKNLGRPATGSYTEWVGLGPDDSPLLARDIGTGEIYALQLDAR